jgi:3-hydroxymyristoyl/3-hydroxydecanoyl-(acyl carrier protein) dehydratase
VLYDEADMLEFAEGRLSRVLGATAAAVDDLPLRVRFPSPPFLAVSRVTRLDAKWGRIGPGSITTEYDVPSPAWNAVDGQCSYLALDAQGLLFLLGAMGVDLENRGRRAFRWLDGTITFLGNMPRAGDTVVYDIAITSFVRESDSMLFFADFAATIDGAPVVRIDRCCAGFFTKEELAQAEGITGARRADTEVSRIARRLPLTCDRRRFDEGDLAALHRGDLAACFGPAHAQAPPNRSLRLPAAPMRMLDRVVSVEPDGGRAGLGALVAEKDLHPEDWYLRAHFKDDPVFAGPCMLEGSLQALQFLALFGGLHTLTHDARFEPLTGRPLGVRFRGQVPAAAGTVSYELDVVERCLEAPEPSVVADVDITAAGRTIGRFEGVGVRLTAERRRR